MSGAAIQQDGTITDCRQLESNLHLRIKSGETTFLAVVNASFSERQWSAGQPIGIGQPIGVQIPLATLHCFDQDSGCRIDFGQTP